MAHADVLIAGAGVAGLAAARDLCAAGREVIVVEARDRTGGRVYTRRDPAWPVPVELGAEFVHGRPREIWEVIEKAGLAACDVTGESWTRDGSLLRPRAEMERFDRLFKAMAQTGEPEPTFGEFIGAAPSTRRRSCGRRLTSRASTLRERSAWGCGRWWRTPKLPKPSRAITCSAS